MKKLALILLLSLPLTVLKAANKDIIATVVFENTTGKAFNSGEFYISEANKRIEINTLDSFKITLPEKGKYIFSFYSDDFETYTFYPVIINERKNTITVKLFEKTEKKKLVSTTIVASKILSNAQKLSNQQIEQFIADGQVHFITHGLDNSVPEEYVAFQEKYGISIKKENCVLDPITVKKTTENNQIIANYLTAKYGDSWLIDLSIKPFGVK
jgi:hypothetical protein